MFKRLDDLELADEFMNAKLAEFHVRFEDLTPSRRNCPRCGRTVAYKAKECGMCRAEL